MVWRRERARYYIEHDVEWWTLIFFLMLFGVSSTLQFTGVTVEIASMFGVFLEWFRVGLASGSIAILVSWLALLVTSPMMFGN